MLLSEFQARFKDLMLAHPDALDAPPPDIAAFCVQGQIPLSARLKVYRNNIVGSLSDLMVGTFPIIEKLVGQNFLELMARSYILEHPPQQGCLSLYGAGFAEFIDGFALAQSLPYLPDVARFELAMNAAYYAKDDRPLKAQALSNLAQDDLADTVLHLRDSVHLIESRYPLLAIKDFCQSENPQGQLDLSQGGDKIMVYRPGLESVALKLRDDEFVMLRGLSKAVTLGETLEVVIASSQEFDFQEFLQKHILYETFRAFDRT